MKKQFAILLIAIIILMLLALIGCSRGVKLELPTYANLQSITVQEIENGQPVSREVALYDELHPRQNKAPDYIRLDTEDYRQITKESQIPSADKCIAYKLTENNGNTRLGTYTSGSTAKRRDYTISMIHCPDGEVIFKSQPVLGGNPPRAINEKQPGGVGDAPAPGSVATELVSAILRIDRTPTGYGLSAAEQALVGEYKISHIQHGAQAGTPEEFGFRSGVTIVLNEDGTGSLGNSSIKWSIETEGHLQMTDESGHGYGLRYDDEYIYQSIVKDGERYTVVFPR